MTLQEAGLPQDPFMLLSVINTKLRDQYPTVAELCRSLDIDIHDLDAALGAAGFEYMESINQYR